MRYTQIKKTQQFLTWYTNNLDMSQHFNLSATSINSYDVITTDILNTIKAKITKKYKQQEPS